MTRALRYVLPFALGLAVLAAWEFLVRAYAVPQFVLPGPSAILSALIADFASLMASLWTTLRITVLAFVLAAVSGIALAILFSQSRILEMMLYPYAVVLQVTPVVAIAPLIIIWVGFERINVALLILAWIVAFFPILANTTLGLRSTDHNLIDLFRLHGASKGQLLWRLKLPSALPFILSGMKTSGGLALIGTVVAEYGAGSGTATGLAWRIIEAGNRLQIPRMFAALILLAGLGIAIFYGLAFLEYLLLRKWHESALPEER
jgi:NitT/TauT family transport system permease protein